LTGDLALIKPVRANTKAYRRDHPLDETNNLLERLRDFGDIDSEPTAEAIAKREVAAQLRALAHAIGSSGASASQMTEVAAQLRAQCAVLEAANAQTIAPGGATAAVAGMEDFRDRSPITGRANPLAPPVTLRVDLDQKIVTGEMTFGPAYEGAPGIVHGGFVAAVLDEALGLAGVFSGGPAMTAELTTRYRHHTPIATELRIEARLDSVDGRKVRTSGAVYQGDQVIVEASGLFIAVDVAKFVRLAAAKAQRADD